MLRSLTLCGFVLLSACASGCNSEVSAPTGEVKGVVTYQGKPLPNVNVMFTPTQGRPGTGKTNANGEFTISTFAEGDGAVPGAHKITITSAETPPMPGSEADPNAPPPTPPFPAKYSDPAQTPLTATINEGEVNEVKLDLVD